MSLLCNSFERKDRKSHFVRRNGSSSHLLQVTKGFSLIELLIVISIIALLMAMLIPAIGMIRFSAHGAVCLNRQKQTAIGIFLYAADNNNQMPYVKLGYWDYYQGKQRNESPGMSSATSVNGMIYPYVQSMRIALCPANKGRHPVSDPNWGAHTALCPDPLYCQGRSNSYGAWIGNDIDPTTDIMNEDHGCRLSQYLAKMQNSYVALPGVVGLTNRYSGLKADGSVANHWGWAEVWGSTLLTEMWGGQHRNGKRRGSTLVNIHGAGVFRTYLSHEINSAPFRQFGRYELE